MKNTLMFGAVALLAVTLTMPAFAEQPAAPSRPTIIDVTKKPVKFPHGVHIKQDCTACHAQKPQHFPPLVLDAKAQCMTCHHMGLEADVLRCSNDGCHDVLDPKDKSVNSLYRIAHDRNLDTSCLGCHYKVLKTRPEKKQTLTACSGSACHPKQ